MTFNKMAVSTLENGGGNRFRSKDKSPECHYPILKYDAELGSVFQGWWDGKTTSLETCISIV